MTKFPQILLAVLLFTAILPTNAQTAQIAQVPQGINYQSVARNGSGTILTNQQISLQLTVHDSSSTGAIVYREHHTVVTNAFGTFSVVVGGGSIITGNFHNVNWGLGDKYLQVEMDFTGGTNYSNMGTSQLMSTPYSLFSGASAGDVNSISFDTTGILNVGKANGNILSSIKNVWLAGGNAGLGTSNNSIGTLDNTDVILKRGGVEGLRIARGGALLATGDNTGVTPASGAGKRMEWIPAKGAFREGSVSGAQWDDANIGSGSSALGNDVLASGVNSTAIGNTASAIGANSQAIGTGVIAKAANSIVLGTYNDTTASGNGLNANDVLFQVGNGSTSSRSNALTVTKSGMVMMQSLVMQDTSVGSSLLPILTGAMTMNPQNKAFLQVYCGGLLSGVSFNLTAGAQVGQVLTVECLVPINLLGLQFGMTLNDHRNSSSSNLILNNHNSYAMQDKDMITLIWDGTYWVETGRSQNHQ